MSSLQIAELTGKNHAHVMRDIRNLIDQLEDKGESNFGLSSYLTEQNKQVPMYNLTKKGCLCLASGYDANLRMKIIDRWEQLENKNSVGCFKVPQTFKEALLLAAEQQEQIEEQQKQLTAQAPKVAFADAIIASKSSCLIGELAKILAQNGVQIGQNRLFEWLCENGYLGKYGERRNVPNQQYVENKIFEIRKGVRSGSDGVLHTTITTKVTGKGQQYFINKFLYNQANGQRESNI